MHQASPHQQVSITVPLNRTLCCFLVTFTSRSTFRGERYTFCRPLTFPPPANLHKTPSPPSGPLFIVYNSNATREYIYLRDSFIALLVKNSEVTEAEEQEGGIVKGYFWKCFCEWQEEERSEWDGIQWRYGDGSDSSGGCSVASAWRSRNTNYFLV